MADTFAHGEIGLGAGLVALATLWDEADEADAALEAAKRAVIDTCGVMLAGWPEAAIAALEAASPDGAEARAIVGGRSLSAEHAARLNGMAGHVLDYDDVAVHGHPSVVLVPAIVAEGQRIGATGRQALAAYVVGYEAWVELCAREADSYHLGSWHPTAVLGVIAATVALASLNRMNAATARGAIGLAASFACGVIGSFGSPAKPLQAGRAAAGAVEAVRLARAGLAGSDAALDGPHGLMAGVSRSGRVDTTTPVPRVGAPHDWRILKQGVSVKRYPVCYASHRAIDGVIELRARTGLQAHQVAAVTATLARSPATTLRFHRPTDGLQARFSLQHALASALLDGEVGFRQLSDDYVRRPDVAALHPLIHLEIDEGQPSPDQPGLALDDRVVIETHDGRRLESGPIRYARGHALRPLSEAELTDKFLACTGHGGVRDGARLLRNLQRLETLATLKDLFA